MGSQTIVKVAVVQAGSELFDRESCIRKACHLVAEAGSKGANLILLPEAFIGGYPRGFSFGAVVGSRTEEGRLLWQRYHDSAVEVPGPDIDRLGEAAAAVGAYVAVGAVERDAGTTGTLYCTILYFGPNGRYLGRHRKLKPTASERLVWGEGDGSTLTVLNTEFGRIGGLICWENYMPLARAALYAKGVGIYLAPTADARGSWQSTMIHVSCEGRTFVLASNQYSTKSMYPADLRAHPEIEALSDPLCKGGSVIVSPYGSILAGPLWDREGMLYAELDMAEVARSRFDFDPSGHYARPDVFHLEVENQPEPIDLHGNT
jgi:nitrilase